MCAIDPLPFIFVQTAEWSELMARDQSSYQSPLEIAAIRMHRSRSFQCVKEGRYSTGASQ